MTDKEAERLEREKDWVTARFRCTVEEAFAELLKVVKADISKFNELSGSEECVTKKNGEYSYAFRCSNWVAGLSQSGESIYISPDSVSLFESGNKRIEITLRWNEAETRCDLIMEDKPVSFHGVSQRLLGKMLFPGYGQ